MNNTKTDRPSKIVPRPGDLPPEEPKSQRRHYRNRALLDLAHEVHTCMNCGKYCPDGCEPAHSNQSRHGKGGAMKAHDCFHAALCHECHAELDQGKKWSRAEKNQVWQMSHEDTMDYYSRNGLIVGFSGQDFEAESLLNGFKSGRIKVKGK